MDDAGIPGGDADDTSDGTPDEIEPEESSVTVTDTVAALTGRAPETVNLVSSINEDEQKRIADSVYDGYDQDWKDGDQYRQKRAQLYKLCFGIMPPKEDGYAQIHYGIMLKAVIRLHARVYDQQFPSSGEYWGCRPTSAADLPRCVRIAKHMNWQTNHQIPEYVPNHDAMIMQWYINGDAVSFMYWSPTKNRPCHEWIPTDDYVLPYAYPQEAADPSMSELPRITRIVRKARFGRSGLDALAKAGYYDKTNLDAIFDDDTKGDGGGSSGSDQSQSPIRTAVDQASGVRNPENGKPAKRVLLEQHTWWKLPDWDEYRPVIATIDKDTKRLLAFILREDEDPEDRARYNREKIANDAKYQAAIAQYEADLQAYMAGLTSPAMNMIPPPVAGMPGMAGPPEPGATTATPAPMPGEMTPSLPGVVPKPEAPVPPALPPPPRMIPIDFFTHYVCIPNPEGIYGYGIGMVLEGNNLTADALGSAIVTQGVLSSTVTGLVSNEAKIRGGEIKVKPGELVRVDALPQDLDKLVHQFKFPPPDPQLGAEVKRQQEDAAEVSGAGDILSGEVGGSNETATTTQIRISQALAAISIQNKRYTRARTEEGRKLARLNSVYLGDDEYFAVIDPFHNTPATDEHISRMDYLEDTAITVTADPRMASQPQRLQEAMQALQVVTQLAPVAPWLQGNVPLMAALIKNIFTAMDRPDLVALSAPPPPPPPGMIPPGPPQPGQGAPPPIGGPPGAGGPPPPNGGPPARPQAPGGGAPRPKPAPAGPTVPNGGPRAPMNGPFMAQNS